MSILVILPNDLLNVIVNYSDIISLCRLLRVSKSFKGMKCLNNRLEILKKKKIASHHKIYHSKPREISATTAITVIPRLNTAYFTVKIAKDTSTEDVLEKLKPIEFTRIHNTGMHQVHSVVISDKESLVLYNEILPNAGFEQYYINEIN